MVDGKPDAAREPLRLVCFHLRQQELALPIAHVRESLRMRPITRVFLTPPWLAGIFSLRGDIVPAIDLAPWLGLPRTIAGDDSRIVVIQGAGKTVGILVDRLSELRTLDPATLAAPPPTLTPEVATLLHGVAATSTGPVQVLDPAALFRSDRMRALARSEVTT